MGLPIPQCAGLGLAAAVSASAPVALRDARVDATPPSPVRPSEPGELSLTILEKPMEGAPIDVWLSSAAVDLPENRLGWDDVVDPQAQQPRLRGRFVAPAQAGQYVVRGYVMYVTCGRKRCRPRTREVRWTVTVEPPDPASTAPR